MVMGAERNGLAEFGNGSRLFFSSSRRERVTRLGLCISHAVWEGTVRAGWRGVLVHRSTRAIGQETVSKKTKHDER